MTGSLEDSTGDGEQSLLSSEPFNVLLVGDGNFSFSLALCRQVWPKRPWSSVAPVFGQDRRLHEHADTVSLASLDSHCSSLGSGYRQGTLPPDPNSPAMRFLGLGSEQRPVHVTATSFDTGDEVVAKYPESHSILARLHRYKNVTVLHRINAWTLPEQFPHQRFDLVIWNHPHLGLEDFRLHRLLLAHFFDSAARVLKAQHGTVAVSVVNGQEERWNIKGQAARARLQLASSTPFAASDYPGYICKRNKNGQSFKNHHTLTHHGHDMWSATHKFSLLPDGDETVPVVDMSELYLPENSFMRPRKEVEKPFQCEHCGKRFASERGIKGHRRQVHELKKYGEEWRPNMERSIDCEVCSKSFATMPDLWQHQVSRHKFDLDVPGRPDHHVVGVEEQLHQAEDTACTVCGARVPSGWGMDAHLESLKPVVGQDMECSRCSQVFIEYRALRQHMNYCRVDDIEKREVLKHQLAH